MATIYGTGGSDQLIGTSGNDVLVGDPQRQEALVVVSSTSAGTASNGYSVAPSYSPDGKFVVFVSQNSNLVPGVSNVDYEIFLKDLTTGEVSLVSKTAAGVQGFQASDLALFSPDGTKVVFMSAASNLIAGDTNGKTDLLMKDLVTGALTRISTDSSGLQANGDSSHFDFSADGTRIVFESDASNLVAGDTNGYSDIFVKDLTTGAVTLVSTSLNGDLGNLFSRDPEFSADGNSVLFESYATNLVTGDTPGADIYVKNLITGAVTKLSTSAAGVGANGTCSNANFSPDGTKVVFESAATNLISGVTLTAGNYVFLKNLVTGAVTLLSSDAGGQAMAGINSAGAFSPDGNSVLFTNSNLGQVTSFIKNISTGVLFNVSSYFGLSNLYTYEFSPDGHGYSFYATGANGITQAYDYTKLDLGSGADHFDGGEGFDIVSYKTALQAVNLNLTDASGFSNTGDALGDTYVSIEAFYLTKFADTFTGSNADDFVFGSGGGDTINGGGGTGDYVSYFYSGQSVTVNLSTGLGSGGLAAGDIYSNIENAEGSAFSDQLIGNAQNNRLDGLDGDDTLDGGLGDDTLIGGAGGDALIGGGGIDTAYYYDSVGGVTLNLGTNTASGGDATGDTISSIENVTGSNTGGDTLTGDGGANLFNGLGGNDTLDGAGGNDTLTGGNGSDTVNGGAGQDTFIVGNGLAGDLDTLNGGTERDLIDMSSISNGAVWYDMGYNQFGANIGGVNLFLTNHNVITLQMESMIGTSFNDIMRGDSGSNYIDGGAGDDTLLSYSPYDTLNPLSSLGDVIVGGTGNDLLFSGTGNDYLDGGIGNDYFEPGAGSDTIVTGTGNDVIWFFPRCGSDIITDFTAGAGIVDVIKLSSFGTSLDSFAEIMANTTQVGADARINLTGTTITLTGVNMASLVADDFLFA